MKEANAKSTFTIKSKFSNFCLIEGGFKRNKNKELQGQRARKYR